MELPEEELARRRSAWQPRQNGRLTGWLARYAKIIKEAGIKYQP